MTDILPRETLEIVIQAASDAVVITDDQLRIVFFNGQADYMFGYSENELIGAHLNTLIQDESILAHFHYEEDFVMNSVERRSMGEKRNLLAKKKSGDRFPVEVTISKASTTSGVFTAVIIRDITERREIEKELQRHSDQLQSVNTELERLAGIKNQFIGMAAHDLRNPLITIRNASEVLLDDQRLNDSHLKLLKIIHSNSEYMLLLISDLLDVNQIDCGALRLNKVVVQVRSFLEEICETNMLIAKRKNTSIDLRVGDDTASSYFDPKRIQQVIENLLSNAIKFSSQGAVVSLSAGIENKTLEIAIRDQGRGIPPAEVSQLFGAFHKLSSKATGGEKGTGLGLVIAKKIVELHGGTIEVESQEGVGSTFTVRLPHLGE